MSCGAILFGLVSKHYNREQQEGNDMSDIYEHFAENPFFDTLPDDIKKQLCTHCHFRSYAKGQRLHNRYWETLTAVLEDGVMVFGDSDEKGRFMTNGLAARGVLISPGTLIDVWHEAGADRDILCLLDCRVAVFDTATVQSLFQNSIPFIHTIYGNIHQHCSVEKHLFLQTVGSRDTYAAVRYILEWCQRCHVPALTHEQIALLCNRSRPTVTETLHEILRREPKLFQSAQ